MEVIDLYEYNECHFAKKCQNLTLKVNFQCQKFENLDWSMWRQNTMISFKDPKGSKNSADTSLYS